MAQNTSVALPASSVKNFIGQSTYCISGSFQATDLSATVTNADRIKLCSLGANVKVIGCSVRLTGTSGVTAIAHLQLTEPTGNNIFLTPTSGVQASPSVAFSAVMTMPHSPITSATATRDLEIVCVSGTISATNGLVWYWDAEITKNP